VLFDNSSPAMVDLEMTVAGLPPYGTAYPRTDYAAIAREAGVHGIRVEPHITGEQLAGFALSASRMVINGGVGRMVQMARSNLRNIPRP
jgi:pyruvate dehydrogenase (quinone)